MLAFTCFFRNIRSSRRLALTSAWTVPLPSASVGMSTTSPSPVNDGSAPLATQAEATPTLSSSAQDASRVADSAAASHGAAPADGAPVLSASGIRLEAGEKSSSLFCVVLWFAFLPVSDALCILTLQCSPNSY